MTGPIGAPGLGMRGVMGPPGPRGQHSGEPNEHYQSYLNEHFRIYGAYRDEQEAIGKRPQ